MLNTDVVSAFPTSATTSSSSQPQPQPPIDLNLDDLDVPSSAGPPPNSNSNSQFQTLTQPLPPSSIIAHDPELGGSPAQTRVLHTPDPDSNLADKPSHIALDKAIHSNEPIPINNFAINDDDDDDDDDDEDGEPLADDQDWGGKDLTDASKPKPNAALSSAPSYFGYHPFHSQFKARDAFYACLERGSNKKVTEIASVGLLYPSKCNKSRAKFQRHCRPSWVKRKFQVFIRYPDLLQSPNRIRTLTLTLDDDEQNQNTLGELKQSLVPPFLISFFYFTLNGKTLDDSSTLMSCGIPSSSTLTLQLKLLGGGGDGGATGAESRDCYLNMYADKKPDKVDPNEKRLSKWTTCALSFEPLKPPCVVDRLGNVFNKEALVKSLLSKSLPKAFCHIRGLKDMITIHLSLNPSSSSSSGAQFHCPITGLEFNGKYKFIALNKCGHVLSAKALKEVKSCACLVCHQEFEVADKIVINGTDEEVASLRERMEEEKALQLKLKANNKKPKKVKAVNGGGVGGVSLDCSSRLTGKKHHIDVDRVEKPAAKLQPEPNGKPTPDAPASAKRFKAVDNAPPNANKKVYASIFTSSKKSDFKETFTCRSLPLGRN